MTVYERLRRRPATFRSLTGMTSREFERLYERVASDIESYEERRLRRPDRKRDIGGGASYSLDGRNRLLMAQIWLRVYPIYEVLGFIFDLHKSNVERNLKPILDVLSKHLEIEWPDKAERTKKKMNEFMQEFPEYVDTFEPEPPIDMTAVNAEIRDLKVQLGDVEQRMADYLWELELDG